MLFTLELPKLLPSSSIRSSSMLFWSKLAENWLLKELRSKPLRSSAMSLTERELELNRLSRLLLLKLPLFKSEERSCLLSFL